MPNFFVVNIVNLILLAGVIFYSVKKLGAQGILGKLKLNQL